MYTGKIINKGKFYISGWIKSKNHDFPVRIQLVSKNKVVRDFIAQRKLKNDNKDKIGKHGFRISVEQLIERGCRDEILIQTSDGQFKFPSINLSSRISSRRPMNLVKRQINRPNIFLVGGQPNSGKTTFTNEFSTLYKGVYTLRLDEIFRNDAYPEGTYQRILGYVDSPMFNKEDFVRLFLNEYLYTIPFNESNTIIIEGWVLNTELIRKKMVQILNLYGAPIFMQLTDHKLKFRGQTFSKSHKENAKAFYEFYKKRRLEELTKRTTYQFYDDLGQKSFNSKTAEKIEKANMPDLKGKHVLDIGCNAGYMSNTFARKGAKQVYGIDVRRVSVSVASQYNNVFYQSPNVKFFHIDVYDFKPDTKIDVVYASSVFHYFRERQDYFFEYMHSLMSANGLMVIEIELYEGEADKAYTYKYQRGVDDSPCHFPNQKMIEKMVKGKFDIQSKKLSVNQQGSKLNRYFFHLKKK